MSVSLALVMALQAQPLPMKTDIPPTFSTVICPDEDAARTMLHSYYDVKPSPNNHIINIDHFFAGLRETGCVQNGPLAETEITIKSVIDRRTIELADGPSVVTAYRGTNAKGQRVIGVVDETENNKHPRTALEAFTQRWASDGYFDATQSNADWPVYRCASFGNAQAAVAAIPNKGSKKAKDKAFAAARTKQKCTVVFSGQFVITKVGTEKDIYCGEECVTVWTPVEAKDRANGKSYGLIFNTTEM